MPCIQRTIFDLPKVTRQLTPGDIASIQSARKSGQSRQSIADEYGVHLGTVSRVAPRCAPLKIGPYGEIVDGVRRLNAKGQAFLTQMIAKHNLVAYFRTVWPAYYGYAVRRISEEELSCELVLAAVRATIVYQPRLGSWPVYVCNYATRRVRQIIGEQVVVTGYDLTRIQQPEEMIDETN